MQFKLTESQIQILIFDWIHLNLKRYPELNLLFHIPNGGYRNIATAKRLKAEGVKSGVPDLFLPIARGGFHGLFIELKTGQGKPTEHQLEWLEKLKAQGYQTLVAYGFDEAVEALKTYLNTKGADGHSPQ